MCSLHLQGDPNVPAGQPTLQVDLTRPVQLPCIEQLRNFSELSRLILDTRDAVSREQRIAGGAEDPGSSRADSAPSPVAKAEENAAQGRAASEHQAQEGQTFALPEEVMSRNEDYPRSCRIW